MILQLLLATLVAAAAAKDSYVILTPSSFRSGIPLSISVNILKSTAPVVVTANLISKSGGDHNVASTSGSFNQGTPGTLLLQVPDGLQSGSYKLQVQGTGHDLNFQNETDLTYESKSLSIFIQTDKATYKPGQTVNYRAFAVFPNLTVYTGPMDVDIYDPNSNKIKQLRGEHDASGVITRFMLMDTQPVIGDWKIKISTHPCDKILVFIVHAQNIPINIHVDVSIKGRSSEKLFTVKHYVLPKFEVTVELPPFGLSSDNSITGTVRAKYTYGKPVKGTVQLRAKLDYWYRPYNYHGAEPMVTQSLNIDGEARFTIPLAHIKQSSHNLQSRSIVVEANVTESLNKITLNGDSTVKFYRDAVKLEFLKSNPTTFKPGLPYTAYLKVAQQDDTPITGRRQAVNVSTRVTYEFNKPATTPYPWFQPQTINHNLANQIFTVPDTGIVPIQINIPQNSTAVNLNVHYGSSSSISAYLSLKKSYSPSNNYMQLFLKTANLRAGQAASFDIKATEVFSNAVYQVMSRGSVVSAGQVSGNSFSVLMTDQMAPNARIVVYYVRADGEIVTDSISFDVDGAFKNKTLNTLVKAALCGILYGSSLCTSLQKEKVTIDFDKTTAQPHENVNVLVTADPSSVVNLLAVDQSVLLMKSGNDITASEVISELKTYDTIKNHDMPFCCDIMPMAVGRKKRMIWWPYPIYYGGSDAGQIFSNAGVKVLTDALVYHHPQPHYWQQLHGGFLHGGGFGVNAVNALGSAVAGVGPRPIPTAAPNPSSQQNLQAPSRVRTVFPETWLWSNATVGVDGKVTINTTIPDTITSWIASAFAVNSQTGLGVSPSTAKVQAFRQFFVSLNLPYSVVRGEQVALQANVFNYMTQDMDVLVTLEQSADFRNVIVDSNGNMQYVSQAQTSTVHVTAGQAKSVFFPIVPAGLGKIDITVKAQSTLAADAVKRQLLVEAEGVEKEYSNPILIDLKNATSFSKTVPLSLPTAVVAGSPRVVVSAIGDLMGPTVNGLDKLLRMPTGCGEQTMIGFAPDVFISNYLTATNQLTGDIEEKAHNYMEKGYQRELTYQHKDGSFSAFGDSDKSGSMWLSAFVVKTFHQAKRQIFIDDEVLKKAINWMISHQASDGRFPEPGRVIHKDMQGGTQAGPGLTAFVLISLLENNDLGGSFQQKINTAAAKAQHYLESQIASVTDDYVLAIASYALKLAKSTSFPTAFAKLNNDTIVRDGLKHWHKVQSTTSSHSHWRPSHQQSNPIDIEMTSYALLIHAVNNDFAGGMPIMKWITGQRNSNGGFASTQDTVVGLQALSDFAQMVYSSSFNIQATITAGTFTHTFNINQANALVLQTVVLPSIPSQVTVTGTGHGMALVDISLSFNVEREIEEPSFDIQVTLVQETIDLLSVRACSRWLHTGASGMAVIEFGIPTGFEADLESIAGVIEIKRSETANRKVILYFDEISTTPVCLTLDIIRTGMVAKSQPASIRLYDYYQPSNQVTKFYQSHVLQNSGICDVCEDCGCPAVSGK